MSTSPPRAHGTVEVAACADPLAGEVFWTDGRAAYQRHGGDDSVLSPSAATRLVDLNLDPPFPNAERFRTVDLLGIGGLVAAADADTHTALLAIVRSGR